MLQGKTEEAIIAEFEEAHWLRKDLAEVHYNLGRALQHQGKLDDAIAEFRTAIRLKQDLAEPHNGLGNALRAKGQPEEAIAECRTAIRLKPDFAEAHANLALALWAQRRLRDAMAAFRRAAEIAPAGSDVARDMPSVIRQLEQQIALDGRLPAVLKGDDVPRDAAERLNLAQLCYNQGLHAAAARFLAEALEADPKLGDDPQVAHRYNAACAAALAGCGQGKDADKLDGRERGRLRRQALDWLRADLVAWRRLLDKRPDKVRLTIAERMRHWLADTDFTGVRGPAALARLPEAERPGWQKLWDDVADTLARVQTKTTPEKKSGSE
jgi:tetratricopeptide (TPR) repeat protein